jgi:hypothetical protein
MSLSESSVPPQGSPSDGESVKTDRQDSIYWGGPGLIIALFCGLPTRIGTMAES